MDKLLPCPFCGGESTRSAKNMHGLYQVFCKTEGCLGSSGWGRDADSAWNRRAQPENKPLTLEEIATAIQIVCENNGCPPDKDCTLGQDCNNCIKEWLAGVGKPEQEEK